MATTLPSNMKYRDPFTQSGYSDRIQQNIAAFNGASAGGIVLRTNRKPGDFDYAAFFKNTTGVVSRQDQSSVSDATAIALQQGEVVDVKLNRKVGPLEWARSAFNKPGMDENALRVAAGGFAADAATQDMLSSGLASAVGALGAQAGSLVSASASLTTADLVSGLAKMGDAASRIAVWVMHSKAYYDLVKEQAFTNKIDGISNFNVQTGTPVTLNRPVLVTDDPALAVVSGSGSSATTSYKTLGLTAGGIVVEDTEGEYIIFQEITGKEQIVIRMQGEYAYNLGVKGFAWDVTNGGKNPVAATLATGSNWDVAYSDVKSRAGVLIASA